MLPHGEGGIRASPRTRKAVLTGILAPITVDFVCLWPIASIRTHALNGRYRRLADIVQHWHEMARSRMTHHVSLPPLIAAVRKAYSITSSAVASNLSGRFAQSLHEQRDAILRRMKVEEIAEAIAKLPPDQLARFRRWFTAFETGRADHAQELDSTATKLGRLAGRAFAELKKRTKE